MTPREFGEKMARCWKGYEPVPGKKPYSEDSCRPVGSKKKKTKKQAGALLDTLVWGPGIGGVAGALAGGEKQRLSGALHGALRGMGVGGGVNLGTLPAVALSNSVPAPVGIGVLAGGAGAGGVGGYYGGAALADALAGPAPWNASAKKAPEKGTDKKDSEDEPEQKMAGTPAWQRAEGKNEAGGLNEKGRKSYERETGGNLKAPVTESNPKGERAKRQNSFCSRMCGMKRVNTGSEAKKDPDSRINKSLRKWNCKCSSALEFGVKFAAQNNTWSKMRFDPRHAQRAIAEHLSANPDLELSYDVDDATPRQLYDTTMAWGKYGPNETPNTFQSQMGARYNYKPPRPPGPGATMPPRPKQKPATAPNNSGAAVGGLPSARMAGTGSVGPASPASATASAAVPPGAAPPSIQPPGTGMPVPPQAPRMPV